MFVAPAASAAATYDITQVGDASWVGVTDSNGNDATKTPLASNGANVKATIGIHVDDMSNLAEGDVVTVSLHAADGSHYNAWSLLGASNVPHVLRNKDGVDMFTLTAVNGHTLSMTRTGEAAVGSFDGSLTVGAQLWVWNTSATSSTWTIGNGNSFTFLCRKFENTACTDDTTLKPKAAVSNGLVSLYADASNCATMRRIAQGKDTSGASTDSLVGWYHITAESGMVSKLGLRGYNVRAMIAVDGSTPGWWDANHKSCLDLTLISGVDVSTFDKAKANLPVGRIAIERQSDGSWAYAFNVGSRLPGLKNSLQVNRAGDEATLELLDKTGRIWQYTQQVADIRFADETVPNRVKVEMQSTESAYQTQTLTAKPIEPAIGAGQSAIRYDPNGGDGDAFRKVGDPGTAATTPEAATFTRTGHTFAGWNTKADGTGTSYAAGAAIAYPAEGRTLTLYAQWKADTYKVEFRDWKGRTITSGTADYGTTPAAPALADTTWLADPDMNFDNVDGWQDGSNRNGHAVFTKDGLQSDTKDLVAFDANRKLDTAAVIHVEARADYSNAQAPTGGIGFRYTNIGQDEEGAWIGFFVCQKGDADCVVDKYMQSDRSGGIAPWFQIDNNTAATGTFGTAVLHRMQLTQVDPATHNGVARDGYVFEGWDKNVTKPVTGDVVYTARYRPAVYKVRFDANGGTGSMADQRHTYDQRQALTANAFAREGYRFAGWNTRADGKGKSFTDGQAVSDLLAHENAVGTLYAQWERVPETAMPGTGGHAGRVAPAAGMAVAAALALAVMARRRAGRHSA